MEEIIISSELHDKLMDKYIDYCEIVDLENIGRGDDKKVHKMEFDEYIEDRIWSIVR